VATPDLIYCGGGNPRFYEIATATGFLYGAQLPDTVYGKLYFADQNWKKPNLERYAVAVAQHRPVMASVLDWEEPNQLPEVLMWAETIAPFVQVIMVIPKAIGATHLIPTTIGGRTVRLGYSVPTRHGGTFVPIWEFGNRPVHLLGGSPHEQWKLTNYLNVASTDGNMCQMMAVRHNAFYDYKKQTNRGYWPSLKDFDGNKWGDGSNKSDAPYEAFKRSCQNIIAMWRIKE